MLFGETNQNEKSSGKELRAWNSRRRKSFSLKVIVEIVRTYPTTGKENVVNS